MKEMKKEEDTSYILEGMQQLEAEGKDLTNELGLLKYFFIKDNEAFNQLKKENKVFTFDEKTYYKTSTGNKVYVVKRNIEK